METTVVRLRRQGGKVVQDCDVYIGRRCNMGGWNLPESKWANPFKIGTDGTRDEVIQKYYNHIVSKPELISSLHELRGKRLGCWCKPNPCHGDILLYILQQYSNTQS
ncbi:hypothetical protein ORPV_1115 [Orpheovirus IHUMI-LCC2]|uniref:DUF4326 domain-containing protein n=1 Tax=Orpheovirus IHUMI-LCC2 TaxID=2023057 RepID=A0A2I2L6D0_9VIRU|nr:hypothetical protein ORPV_1115 [Orpheovirus IHUMI-LCC2]SNW63019.1 Domain of unknown function (DUF4326) [Orpheovirus IHUMI-LCC2]